MLFNGKTVAELIKERGSLSLDFVEFVVLKEGIEAISVILDIAPLVLRIPINLAIIDINRENTVLSTKECIIFLLG